MSKVNKECTKCNTIKSLDNFRWSSKSRCYISSHCKTCQNKYKSEKRKLDPEKESIRTRKRHYKNKYGITLDQYNKMFEKQKGLCAICNKSQRRYSTSGNIRLAVDHNHNTGKVRELLCTECNVGIGYAQDNPEILKSMIAYLEKHK